ALAGRPRAPEAVRRPAEEPTAADTHRIEEKSRCVGGKQPQLLGDHLTFQAGRVAIDEKCGHSFVAGSGFRLREDYDNVGDRPLRNPELAPVKHPAVSVTPRGQVYGPRSL